MKHLMITVLMAASFGVHALEQVPPSCKGYYENPKYVAIECIVVNCKEYIEKAGQPAFACRGENVVVDPKRYADLQQYHQNYLSGADDIPPWERTDQTPTKAPLEPPAFDIPKSFIKEQK